MRKKDYEEIRGNLRVILIPQKDHNELLRIAVHSIFEDLAIVVCIDTGKIAVPMGKELVADCGVTEYDAISDALENTEYQHPPKLMSLLDKINELMGEADRIDKCENNEDLFIASNDENNFGAAVMFYQGFLEKAAKRIGGSFYVLPSSVHEVLLKKDKGEDDADMLACMVRRINVDEVDPRERLSDSVYYYDAEKGELKKVST